MKQISSQVPRTESDPTPPQLQPVQRPAGPDPRVTRVLLSLFLIAAGAALFRTTVHLQPENQTVTMGNQGFQHPLGTFQTAAITIDTASTRVSLSGGASGVMEGTFKGPEGTQLLERKEENGSQLSLNYGVKYPRTWLFNFFDGGNSALQARLTERLPLDLQVNTASGDVDLRLDTVKLNRLAVETASGNYRIELPGGTQAPVQLNTASGNLRVNTRAGSRHTSSEGATFQTDTVSGDQALDLSDTGYQDIHLHGVSGWIKAHLPARSGLDARLDTVSGGQEVTLSRGTRGDLQLETVSGEVVLRVALDLAVEVQVETLSGQVDAPGFGATSTGRYRIGPDRQPDVTVRISTTSGDIDLQQGAF